MALFKKFEQIDGAVNHGYARWGKWVWAAILAPIIIYGGYIVWASIWGPPTGPVTLVIHSEIDRPIRGFSVNGVAGGNTSARDNNNPYGSDGGKSTCCGIISGKTAEIIWTVDYTLAQYKAGLRTEVHEVLMPLPKRQWGENYLHVYFLSGDKVRLWWGTGFVHPSASEIKNGHQYESKKE